jgi:isoleucyl-tRNA synthetase
LEGSDQYRGWFNSSLTTSVAISGHAPYKGVLSHGFTLDGNGRKMSKSVGNVIVPEKVMNQFGAEILRLWVSSVDYTADVRVSDSNFKQVGEVYRKIRNTFRFVHGNTSDFNPNTDSVAFENLRPVDQYVYVKLQGLIKEVRQAYEDYEFAAVYHAVNNFCTGILSSFYLDIAKDVVYIENKEHPHRRSMQTVMYESLFALVKLLAPILPHTADEMWSHLEHVEEDSVQLTDMPEAQDFGEKANQLVERFATLMLVRDDVLKALEVARNDKGIGKSLEAKVTVFVPEKLNDIFKADDIDYAQFFIVSKFIEGNAASAPENALKLDTVSVLVEKADGEKCDRCWTISETVGADETHPEICTRCAEVVKNFYS